MRWWGAYEDWKWASSVQAARFREDVPLPHGWEWTRLLHIVSVELILKISYNDGGLLGRGGREEDPNRRFKRSLRERTWTGETPSKVIYSCGGSRRESVERLATPKKRVEKFEERIRVASARLRSKSIL